jgi:hypothetical protein
VATPPARSRRRRRWFVLVAVLLVLLLVEVGAAIVWSLTTGSLFTWSGAAAVREAARLGVAGTAAGTKAAAVERATNDAVVLHPYLGYVLNGDEVGPHGFRVSRHGFLDDAPPVRARRDDRYVVALVGGSVALQLGLYAGGELATALAASPALAGRTVEIVRLGLGGYKQPQQLFSVAMVLLLGGQVDCVVNLDGFNEVALVNENVPLGVPEWYPRSWARLVEHAQTPEQLLRMGEVAVLRRQRGEAIATADALWWSPTVQLFWQLADRRRAFAIADVVANIERTPPPASAFVATGPGPAPTAAAAHEGMVEVWARSSRQLAALCRANGAAYVHCLQPNQYLPGSKPIGDAERAIAIRPDHPWGKAVVDYYPRLQAAGRALRAEGIAFHDLTGIYRDHPEPLYSDRCCHLNQLGNQLLARHVAAAVRGELDLRGVVIRTLRVEPERVLFDRPFAARWLAVRGVDADGRTHDLAGAGLGVRIGCEPEGMVQHLPDGRLRAVRRGEGVLLVEHGASRVRVPFASAWPSVRVDDDGVPARDGAVPAVLVDDPVLAGREVGLRIVGLPTAPVCLLVAGPRPLPASPAGASVQDLLVTPIVPEGGVARARLTLPASGEALFVAVYALGADADELVARSATLALMPE